MLVYLDSSHLAALDTLLRRGSTDLINFLEPWIERGCRLVISRAHMHEIGQMEDDSSVAKRLELLRYFTLATDPANENVDGVITREVLAQTRARLECRRAGSHENPYASIQKQMLQPGEAEAVAKFVWGARPAWAHEKQHRVRMAEQDNLLQELRALYAKLSKGKAPKPGPELQETLRAKLQALPQVRTGDPVQDAWLVGLRERGVECATQPTIRRMKICSADVAGMPAVKAAPEADITHIGWYRALGIGRVLPMLAAEGYAPDEIRDAVNHFDPYDAPGISLGLCVKRGRGSHPKAFEAGDYVDVDHVLWAAHADLAFVDKRTYGFYQQARATANARKLLSRHITVAIRKAATLKDVLREIAALP